MKKLVSVLIPAYNAEEWISETIRSAINQTYKNKEIIVVDDGSTDNTLRIANKFQERNVKVISQEKRGVCAARNKAFDNSQGDYIQWLDADDVLHPEKIRLQMMVAESVDNPRVLLTSSYGSFFYRTWKAVFRPSSLWRDLSPVDWLVTKFNEGVWLNPMTWLVSRKLSKMAGRWDERLVRDNDGEYICRVVSLCEAVRFVSSAKSYYRIGNIGNISSDVKLSAEKLESMFLSILLQNKYLISLEDSDRTRAACIKHIQTSYIYFFPDSTRNVLTLNDIVNRMGGVLSMPKLKFRYSILQKIFGWKVAKYALFVLPKGRWLIRRQFDKLFWRLSM